MSFCEGLGMVMDPVGISRTQEPGPIKEIMVSQKGAIEEVDDQSTPRFGQIALCAGEVFVWRGVEIADPQKWWVPFVFPSQSHQQEYFCPEGQNNKHQVQR